MRFQRLIFTAFLFLAPLSCLTASAAVFEKSETPEPKYFAGEKLTYKISYLGVPVGEAVSEIVEKTVFKGRPAYHIRVKVKSYRLIDFIYKVRDEHHSYIDAENLSSLAYSADIREGFNRFEEKSEYDFKTKKMRVTRSGKTESLDVPVPVQDQLSCGYFFRTLTVQENSSVFIPVHAEGRNWSLEVKTFTSKPDILDHVGVFESALETEPIMPFRGIFFRKGKIKGSISLDKRRIPLRMTVKIPVLGNISSELIEYVPGRE